MKSPTHLNALRAFEASARHGSFSGAAGELNVTAAAVGQLVRGLEDWLGSPLFHRSASGPARLALTDLAENALPDIRAGLGHLSLGLERMKETVASGLLTVAVNPAFAAKWLLPRFDRFQAEFPDIDVRLDTSLKLIDYVTHGIDVGVRYGAGSWPGLTAEKLMDEEIFPVCSPVLQETFGLAVPTDIAHHTLIHDQSADPAAGLMTWTVWLKKAGIDVSFRSGGIKINNSTAVLQAAIDGQGIALARGILARDDLAAGRLVRLFPQITVPSALAYYVVYRPECVTLSRFAAFRGWLITEAAKDAALAPPEFTHVSRSA